MAYPCCSKGIETKAPVIILMLAGTGRFNRESPKCCTCQTPSKFNRGKGSTLRQVPDFADGGGYEPSLLSWTLLT
jgi:hypothetical protein